MSELDKAWEQLNARRRAQEAARKAQHERALAFVAAFFAEDIRPSTALASHGVESALTDGHILLRRPAASVYDDALVIAVGEHGDIDVGGKSLGRLSEDKAGQMKQELIAEIIARFDL
jgi:hypothetical protein